MQNQGITFCLCCQNGVPLLELVNCTIVLLFIIFFFKFRGNSDPSEREPLTVNSRKRTTIE